jgi:hypothetical protein
MREGRSVGERAPAVVVRTSTAAEEMRGRRSPVEEAAAGLLSSGPKQWGKRGVAFSRRRGV